MSDQFQHVMVLTSIIIGLGITNLLLGLSGAIERFYREHASIACQLGDCFLAYLFLLMVLFWWWEFRLLEILKTVESVELLLVICYAVILFLGGSSYSPRLG
jgi:hypothetical protein